MKAKRENHGMYGTPTYLSWYAMKQRCDNKRSTKYHAYGAKGVSYDPAWASFSAFFADMGERPFGTTLDRKDHNLPYSKDNCRWATAEQQNRNRRNTVWIAWQGQTRCVEEWSRITGIPRETVRRRAHRYPNNPDKIFEHRSV